MSVDHYTYRVTWSPEDGEHVGLCAEFPPFSWLARTPEAEKHYSGEFRVRIPPDVHRALAVQAAEQGISLNRLASAKLAA